ncbi:MAG: efflux RND transporter periplasmic adaptor subunit [Acidithiobacillus sp.]
MSSSRLCLQGALALFLALALSACQKAPHRAPPPLSVQLVQVKTQDAVEYRAFLATVTPLQTVTLVPQTSGILQTQSFVQGGKVERGQVLFRIDPAQAQASVAQAAAKLAADEATARYQARLVEQDAPLVAKDFITRQSYEQAVSQAQAARAAVQADRAALRQAQLNLGYTVIRAPISGTIGMALVKPGNVVTANQTQLAVINQVHPIAIDFQIPQGLLAAARTAQRDALPLPVVDEKTGASLATAHLRVVDNGVQAATATVRLQAEADNDNDALWPGQYVEIRLPVRRVPDAQTLPAGAVQQGQSGSFVYLAPGGTVRVQKVELLWEDGPLAVIRGLPARSAVVYPVPARIYPGAKVLLPGASASDRAGSHRGGGLGHEGRRP